jgi:hypothetical protein
MFSLFSTPKRVLADIRREGTQTQLWFAGRQLDLKKLSGEQLASIATLPTTIVIEADVKDRTVVGLGDTKPHPRTAFLRAVQDLRFSHAREYLEQLGEAVESDIESLMARMTLNRRTAGGNLDADFHKLLALPGLTLEQALTAYEGLGGQQRASCAPAFVGFAERLTQHPPLGLDGLLGAVPQAHWGTKLPVLAIAERTSDTPVSDSDLEQASRYLVALEGKPEHAAAAAQIETARVQLAEREKKKAKALLASRPNFDEIEQLFGRPLPAALRNAWFAHYEGDTVGFGFIEVKKGKVDKLSALAKKLERSLEDDERQELTPHQLLPFAIGEHDGDYFALDLARPSGSDFAVRGVFNNGTGGNVLAYETSDAWLAADGTPRY